MNGFVIALLVVIIASMVICYAIARRRGGKASFWAVMGALFGPLAIPFAFLAKPKD